MFVIVAGSLRVLLPCVHAGAFVRAYLMLMLIWTVGSHFFSIIIIIFLPSCFNILIFSFFSSPLCVCQECACAKSLIVHNQELDVTPPVPGVR